ncbi:MAG: DUF1194 domain-containing protein [Pseudomonadota bacterium]
MSRHAKRYGQGTASWLWPVLALLLLPNVAAADAVEVDVELVLAVDASWSMTPREQEIQRRGYAEALTSEEVVSAITGGFLGRVALTYVVWSGHSTQDVVIDWTMISDRKDAEAFAELLISSPDGIYQRTSISGALLFAASRFENNGFVSNRQVIDVSGDGPNNDGTAVVPVRDALLERGIVINGLPLMTKEGRGQIFSLDDLDEYYRHCVIGGPGAFVLPVLDWEQFPMAVRQKLVLELADSSGSQFSYTPTVSSGYDCLVGEKLWEKRFGPTSLSP